ncbi:MAG TPA: sulfotransferase domain-containing protein [Chitinophagales bacterium]|nr:sulfotransferase domain-containing protein [Chitinophagales bacterium]
MNNPSTLIHIGYPKAASTLLQHYFSTHPNVYYSGNLLGNYKFSGEVQIPTITLATGQTHVVVSEEQLSVWQGNLDIVGVKFKTYDVAAQQQKTAQQLHIRFPGAKILIVTRGFQSALQSMYSQYVSIGGILKFEEFEQQFGSILSAFYNYDYVIHTYRSIFGAGNVLVLPFEMLRHQPKDFINRINQFGGLPEIDFDVSVKNASLGKEEVESYRKLSWVWYKTISWLPYKAQQALYGLYVYMLYTRKLSKVTGLFSSKVEPIQVSDSTLALFAGKAEALRGETLYHPYWKEYLL